MRRSMGMIQVDGTTYRIERVREGYDVVRLLDDTSIGRFGHASQAMLAPGSTVELPVLRAVALTAKRQARTEWPRDVGNQVRTRTPVGMLRRLALLGSFWRAEERSPVR